MEITFLLFFIFAVFIVVVIISTNSPDKFEWQKDRNESSSLKVSPKVTEEINLAHKEKKIDSTLANLLASSKDTDKFDIDLLKKIEWKRFEEVCAAYLTEIKFICKTQNFGADGGIDIHLYWGSETNRVAIVQCKAWPDKLVGVDKVRELFGVMKSENVRKAFFMTSHDFTAEAKTFASNKSMTLMTGNELVERVNKLSEAQVKKLLTIATKGDYKTPTCAKCGKKMVMRLGKLGRPNFWGCSGFPRCRHKMNMKVTSQLKLRSSMLY